MLGDLLDRLYAVDDPRQAAKVEHRLADVLAISVCAVLAGAESFEDIALYGEAKRPWLSRHLDLAGGVPSHDTVRRVLMLIDPLQFEDAFLAWTRATFGPGDGETSEDAPMQIAVDGKALRRSFDRRGEKTPLHLISAFATHSGLVLAQRRVTGAKTDGARGGKAGAGGEMGALPDLLAGLDLRGTLASLDAGFCHPRMAQAVRARGGDYLIALKGNCPGLHGPVRDWFDAHAFTVGGGLRPCADAFDDRHGRLVRRQVFVADADVLQGDREGCDDKTAVALTAWPDLRRIVAVEAIRSVENPPPGTERQVTTQVRYFLTSAQVPDTRIADAIRAHWAIENGLHWVLDTGFGEDHSRVRDQNAAANLAVLRRIALNLVRADPSKGSLKAKRKRAAWDDNFMRKIVMPDVHA
jgi:predicted transposase YbfD/YdcC